MLSRVEGDAGNAAGLPREGVKQLATGSVPQVDGTIGTAAGQLSPRWVESHACNLAALPLECAPAPFKGVEQLAVDGIPKRYSAVEAAAGELLKSRIKRYELDRAMVPFQRTS
jgi:hypothetical protein